MGVGVLGYQGAARGCSSKLVFWGMRGLQGDYPLIFSKNIMI